MITQFTSLNNKICYANIDCCRITINNKGYHVYDPSLLDNPYIPITKIEYKRLKEIFEFYMNISSSSYQDYSPKKVADEVYSAFKPDIFSSSKPIK